MNDVSSGKFYDLACNDRIFNVIRSQIDSNQDILINKNYKFDTDDINILNSKLKVIKGNKYNTKYMFDKTNQHIVFKVIIDEKGIKVNTKSFVVRPGGVPYLKAEKKSKENIIHVINANKEIIDSYCLNYSELSLFNKANMLSSYEISIPYDKKVRYVELVGNYMSEQTEMKNFLHTSNKTTISLDSVQYDNLFIKNN